VNWLAIGVWGTGFVLYLLIAGLPQIGFSGLAPWLGATIPTYLFGLVTYAVVGRATSGVATPVALGAD
jgi:hypothetical protein